MRVEKWDILMHRLLTEKKEKEAKASKSKGSKPDYLDLDKDGDTSEPMKKAAKESGGKKEAKPKKGKGKIPPQLKMHIKKKKSKLDEAIERLERVLIKEDLMNDLRPFREHEYIDDYENQMVAALRTDFSVLNNSKDPFTMEAKEKISSGEFNPNDHYPYRGTPELQYFVKAIMDLAEKLDPEAEVLEDRSPSILFKTEDKQSFVEFLDAVKENQERLDQLGCYRIVVYGGKILDRNKKEPMTPWMRNGYRIDSELDLLKDSLVDTEGEVSAPGAVSAGQIQEMIRRIEKMILEELSDSMLDEYGGDRHPPIEDTDDDDDMPGYEIDDAYNEDYDDEWSEEELKGDYDWQTVDKFADMDKDSDDEDMDDDYDDLDDDDYDDLDDDDDYEEDLEETVEYLSESEVKKKKPRLGKVTRNPSGSKKKFHVYVKCGGRVKKISFGDPGLSIKRDSAARRKNFRARHKCDKPAGKDRCTARYWSCYQWRAGKKVEGEE